jgi:membrane-bound lytic murein transglycosylase B
MFGRLEKTYGVKREILDAIWGIETSYGESQGGFNLFEALATLAYDGPRADYGRTQFLAALKIAQVEHLNPQDMSGSWAGAIGHTQFVPTTFLDYAVDGDGDGKRDLWNSPTDALASTANYMKELGWHEGEPWGEEVQLPAGFAYEEADPDIRKARDDWAREGVRNAFGQPLKGGEEKGAIFLPAGYRGPAFLTFGNFEVLQQYNASVTYALAIGILADRLRGGGVVMAAWPNSEPPLARDQMTDLQSELTTLGYDAGPSDGLLGKRTRAALRAYQKAKKLPADGFPTLDLFYKILEDVRAKGK